MARKHERDHGWLRILAEDTSVDTKQTREEISSAMLDTGERAC